MLQDLPRFFEIGFPPIIRGLSACTPWIWCASPCAKPRGRYHLPYDVRLQRLGLHSSQRRRIWCDLMIAFKIFTGLLIQSCLFSLPSMVALNDSPTRYSKVRAIASGEGQLFRWGFRRYNYFCQRFQEEVGKNVDWRFPHLPHWLKPHHLTSLTLPSPKCTSPINSTQIFMLPESLLCVLVSSGPLWPTFCHYKSIIVKCYAFEFGRPERISIRCLTTLFGVFLYNSLKETSQIEGNMRD